MGHLHRLRRPTHWRNHRSRYQCLVLGQRLLGPKRRRPNEVIKGELSIEDVTEGEYIRNWESAAKRANGGHFHGHLHHDDVKEQIADFAHVTPDELQTEGVPAQHQAQAVELIKTVSNINATFDAGSAIAPLVTARANQASGTEFEAALMTPMVQTYLGLDGLPLTAPVMDDMSLLEAVILTTSVRLSTLRKLRSPTVVPASDMKRPHHSRSQVLLMPWN